MKLHQYPEGGSRVLLFCGDSIEFRLKINNFEQYKSQYKEENSSATNSDENYNSAEEMSFRAFVRTNIGHAAIHRYEVINAIESQRPSSSLDWSDFPMEKVADDEFKLILPLTEVGHFEAKCCCFLPGKNLTPVWCDGENISINVEPAIYAGANSVYCAFVRQFGSNKNLNKNINIQIGNHIANLEQKNYSVIPPSGTFKDLIEELDFIINNLNCRIIHLLPINPTPTVYGRMGRFGSPYAGLDFTGIDPALAEFSRYETPLEQFLQLVDEIHRRKAKVFIDIVINHTGWAAKIHEEHPEWLVREEDGAIHSPGAWGVTWGDLTELDYSYFELWEYLAADFLEWCRRGVDGFRCDAGYMIDALTWEYIICKVREEFPDTVFLLEGLGGDPLITRNLLNTSNMNWAYSELFQNYSREAIYGYLNYAQELSKTDGIMIHYAETHDNNRLAAVSSVYSQMRCALCALTSFNGAFGFANGVEWFATEKIDVHEAGGLNWGADKNQVQFIRKLNDILSKHREFQHGGEINNLNVISQRCNEKFDGSEQANFFHNNLRDANIDQHNGFHSQFDDGDNNVVMFERINRFDIAENPHEINNLIIIINTNCNDSEVITIDDDMINQNAYCKDIYDSDFQDLISDRKIKFNSIEIEGKKYYQLTLYAGESLCLKKLPKRGEISREKELIEANMPKITELELKDKVDYITLMSARCEAVRIISHIDKHNASFNYSESEKIEFAKQLLEDPKQFLYDKTVAAFNEPRFIKWQYPKDLSREVMLLKNFFTIIETSSRFRAKIADDRGKIIAVKESLPVTKGGQVVSHFIILTPFESQWQISCDAYYNVHRNLDLILSVYDKSHKSERLTSKLLLLADDCHEIKVNFDDNIAEFDNLKFLQTNKRGGMLHCCVNWGEIRSRYDVLLGANLSDEHPEDRHVFLRRYRLYLFHNGRGRELNKYVCHKFFVDETGVGNWFFEVPLEKGKYVALHLQLEMDENNNVILMRAVRCSSKMFNASCCNKSQSSCDKKIRQELHSEFANRRKDYLPDDGKIKLLIRVDIEDRNFHYETKAARGPQDHWPNSITVIDDSNMDNEEFKFTKGFDFKPSSNRIFQLRFNRGEFVRNDEWNYNILQSDEAERGLEAYTDLYSPGYIEIDLNISEVIEVKAEGRLNESDSSLTAEFAEEERAQKILEKKLALADGSLDESVKNEKSGKIENDINGIQKLEYQEAKEQVRNSCCNENILENGMLHVAKQAMKNFVVNRDGLKTVIAGYPWFLDWGRDTLICARGLLSAGYYHDVTDMAIQFAKFAENGTLPNMIHGSMASNRDTSDAPLWLFKVCEDILEYEEEQDLPVKERLLMQKVDGSKGNSMAQVLLDMIKDITTGTPNGVRMDSDSSLIYSPSHFTWMDTNYPAATPRRGYPIEIQALWYRALKFVASFVEDCQYSSKDLHHNDKNYYLHLAEDVKKSVLKYYVREHDNFISDCLHCETGFMVASRAKGDDHLRPNQLLAVTLGLIDCVDDRDIAEKIVLSSYELLIPGAIRSLAKRSVEDMPLEVSLDGFILNDKYNPYCGNYHGDEDTQRKKSYHNGTAWTWMFPLFSEAYYMVYGEAGRSSAKTILSSSVELFNSGCVMQLPEIVDGDYPHTQRGCDAQAWGITEFYRVWKMLDCCVKKQVY
ncbi:amylo-alpha-1,6-glucosidase [Lentisphaerota bacterium WC36G]|nr:glycogen debranching enzyme N-terminal domain-containing protein [Lentisphaerae bacterium WC36]